MTKRKPGRKPIYSYCQLCRRKFSKTVMRLHEPTCRRRRLLKIGARFTVMLNQRLVPVEIESFMEEGTGLVCRNLETGRSIRVKSPRRFREWMDRANIRFHRATA